MQEQRMLSNRKYGYSLLCGFTLWAAGLIGVIFLQVQIAHEYSAITAVNNLLNTPFLDDSGVQVTLQGISSGSQWFAWLRKVLLANIYGVSDLGDLSSEGNLFTCANSETIFRFQRCDGEADCADKSDEAGCNLITRRRVLSLPTTLDLDFNQDNPSIHLTCVNSQVVATSVNGATFFSADSSVVSFDSLTIDTAAQSHLRYSAADVSIDGSTVLIAFTNMNQFHKLMLADPSQNCSQGPVTLLTRPIESGCLSTEFSCLDAVNQSLTDDEKFFVYGNKLGRCLAPCQLCDGARDCVINGQGSFEEEANCNLCSTIFPDFSLNQLVVSGAITFGTQRFKSKTCTASQLSDLSSECVTSETRNEVLCAGYCPTLVDVTDLVVNQTSKVDDCFTTLAHTAPEMKFISANGPFDPEEALRTQNCLPMQHVAFVGTLSLADVYAFTVGSQCPHVAEATLKKLEGSNYVDALTKSVGVSLVLFSPNTNLLLLVEAVVTFSAEDSRATSVISISNVKLDPYGIHQSYVIGRIVLEVLVLLVVIFFAILLFKRWYNDPRRFFRSAAHVLDLVLVLAFFATMAAWFYFVYTIYRIQPLCSPTADVRTEQTDLLKLSEYIRDAAYFAKVYHSIVVGLMFVIVLQTFRVLTFQAYLKLLVMTMRESASLLLSLMILVIYTFATFSFVAHLAFGSKNASFNTIGRVIPRLFAMMIGELNYSDLYSANPEIAPVFLIFFVVVVSLVVLNLVIAVVIHSFEQESTALDAKSAPVASFKRMVRKLLVKIKLTQLLPTQEITVMQKPQQEDGDDEMEEVEADPSERLLQNHHSMELLSSTIQTQFSKLEAMQAEMNERFDKLQDILLKPKTQD